MKTILVLLLLLVAGLAIKSLFLSFRAQRPSDYAATSPAFVLDQHLSGPLLSEGVVYGPGGRVTNGFVARMHGSWSDGTGTLTEDFTYSNGKRQRREWTLEMGSDGAFTATADDIVGVGRGVVSGSTVMLRYRITLPEESGGHTLDVVDWLYLMENGVIMNRSELRKFGIKVAELVATMRPDPAEQSALRPEAVPPAPIAVNSR